MALPRSPAPAYAQLIDEVLAPAILGRGAHDRRALWRAMRAALTGRAGTASAKEAATRLRRFSTMMTRLHRFVKG